MRNLVLRAGALVATTTASLALVACGTAPAATTQASSPTPTPTPTSAPVTFTDEQVQTAEKLEEMRGHLYSSVANADAGNFIMARMHAGHPYQEGYVALQDQIAAVSSSLSNSASTTLQQTFTALASSTDPAKFASEASEANDTIDRLAEALIPDDIRASLSFRAAVLAALVGHSADEYGAGVDQGEVTVLEEYQDGFGFYNRAKQLWADIEDQIKASDPGAYTEIEEQLGNLDTAFTSVLASAGMPASSDVLQWTEELARELEDSTGATPSGTPSIGADAASQLSALASNLDDAMAALNAGDVARAQASYTEFDDGWFAIEDGVRAKSRDAYRAIEEAMSTAKNELIRSSSPDVEKANAALQALDQVIDSSVPELR